jgi:hypothetical protein
MSGTNYEITCPNCQLDCSVSEDHKLFPCSHTEWTSLNVRAKNLYHFFECFECGFVVYTSQDKYLTLEELNWKREEVGLNPLTKLPDQTWANKLGLIEETANE